MTYIEFFDKAYIENICVSLIHTPDRIILVGSDSNALSKHITRYDELFRRRGLSVIFEKRGVNKNNLQSIVETLEAIINTYDDCHFDLTGGDELYLAAMGIVFERYKDKNINMHRYSIFANKLFDCDGNGETILFEKLPEMTVSENIRLYGGEIINAELTYSDTTDINTDITNDINTLWRICCKDQRVWNNNVSNLERLVCEAKADSNGLSFSVTEKQYSDLTKSDEMTDFVKKLTEEGLIVIEKKPDTIRVKYKNRYVKSCLEKSGKILELKIFVLAKDLINEDGNKIYNDTMSGITIDWDGVISRDVPNTENEIDIILMHGVIPVFISCKNGQADVNELYKLNTVAQTFGGQYSRKVLIAGSSLVLSKAVKRRAADMGVGIISSVHNLSDEVLSEKLSALWK